MITFNDSLSIHPIYKVSTPIATLDATDTASEVDFRLGQIRMAHSFHDFVKGHDYIAKITQKLDANQVLVNVNGHHIQMTLEQELALGKQLHLRFLGSNPTPSFMLLNQAHTHSADADIQLSQTAKLISQMMQTESIPLALRSQTSVQGQAVQQPQNIWTSPVTALPLGNSALIAHDIKHMVSMSGLFYESHLAAYAQGQRSLTSLLQEPQNLAPQTINAVTAQQLQTLESNKFEWQGQVWQNQHMHLSIEKLAIPANYEHHAQAKQSETVTSPIESHLQLNLPKLGDVRAVIRLENGQLKIHVSAQDNNTVEAMKQASHDLIDAFKDAQQSLIALSITSEDANAKR